MAVVVVEAGARVEAFCPCLCKRVGGKAGAGDLFGSVDAIGVTREREDTWLAFKCHAH